VNQIARLTACIAALLALPRRSDCQRANSQASRPDTVNWAIVKAVLVSPEGCCNSMRAFRIAIASRGRFDTLPVLSLQPDQLGDGSLFLRVVSKDQAITLARYHAGTGVLDSVPPPTDYEPTLAHPAFYGPRRLLAYDVDTLEESRVVVRRWPHWQLVASGPVVQHCNEVPLNVEWTSTGRYVRFEFCRDDTPERDSLKVPGR